MKRRFVFSLRALLACVLLVGLVTVVLSQYFREVQVAGQIQQAGGAIIWDGRRDVWEWNTPWQRVAGIYFTGSQTVNADTLALIAQLAKPRGVGLAMTSVDDQALAMLRNATTITNLDLTGTAITDSGIKHLHELKRIRHLKLDHTQVSYREIERLLKRLPRLRPDFTSQLARRRCQERGGIILRQPNGAIVVIVADEATREDVTQHARWIPAEVAVREDMHQDWDEPRQWESR